jgi:GT2 family glycosyltransferase
MSALPVSIVVVPRERFSDSIASLESLYANTPMPCEMIYVDGNSPEPIKHAIEQWSVEKKFKLIRSERYLSPNQARNLGLSHARNKYIAFVDNDVRVMPGWLEHLVTCAEETGAWVVAPLYLEGELEERIVHTAGGIAQFRCIDGKRVFTEEHRFNGRKLDSVLPNLRRETIELVEFHCVLIRSELFERTGPLDERLMSVGEHLDLSFSARERGKLVYTEPAAIISYTKPMLAPSDVEYFVLRWSDNWTQLTSERMQEKWNLSADDPGLASQCNYARNHRPATLLASGLDPSDYAPPTDAVVSDPVGTNDKRIQAGLELVETNSTFSSYIPPVRFPTQIEEYGEQESDDWSTCAQTVVQLFNQLYSRGYSKSELSVVGNAYQLIMRLFSGQFRPNGKTFIAHLVGTASILAKLSVETDIVLVGLLHAIYEYGDFGALEGLEDKRNYVRSAVSDSIEQMVFAYHELKWHELTIADISDRLDQLDQLQGNVVLVRLANELEEVLDFSIAYCGERKYESYYARIARCSRDLEKIADKLGFAVLGQQLARAPQMMRAMPRRLFEQLDLDRSFSIAPQSLAGNTQS